MADYQTAKALVSEYYRVFDAASVDEVSRVLRSLAIPDYKFRGVHPFNELDDYENVAAVVWEPVRRALKPLQRLQDVFMAGTNEVDGQPWVCSMGHLMGLLDEKWLEIPATGKLVFLRYAQFHRIVDGQIAETDSSATSSA